MRGLRRSLVVLAVVVLAASCTSSKKHDDPSPTPTSTKPSPTKSSPSPTASAPTVPADVPTTGKNVKPGETPPVEPVAATHHDAAGAAAFAKFFVQTIDWAYATMSTTYMRHYFEDSCTYCTATARPIDQAAAKGQYIVGARYINYRVETPSFGSVGESSVGVTIDIQSGELVDQSGSFVDGTPAKTGVVWTPKLTWKTSSWVVTDAGLTL